MACEAQTAIIDDVGRNSRIVEAQVLMEVKLATGAIKISRVSWEGSEGYEILGVYSSRITFDFGDAVL